MNNCKDCGELKGQSLFLWLSNSLWKEIGMKPNEFLCAHCTITRLEKTRMYVYAIGGEGKHKIWDTKFEIEMKTKDSH